MEQEKKEDANAMEKAAAAATQPSNSKIATLIDFTRSDNLDECINVTTSDEEEVEVMATAASFKVDCSEQQAGVKRKLNCWDHDYISDDEAAADNEIQNILKRMKERDDKEEEEEAKAKRRSTFPPGTYVAFKSHAVEISCNHPTLYRIDETSKRKQEFIPVTYYKSTSNFSDWDEKQSGHEYTAAEIRVPLQQRGIVQEMIQLLHFPDEDDSGSSTVSVSD